MREQAASRLEKAGAQMMQAETSMKGDPAKVNQALIDTERAFLIDGLPDRPWFKHAIYAPGKVHRIRGGGDSGSQ